MTDVFKKYLNGKIDESILNEETDDEFVSDLIDLTYSLIDTLPEDELTDEQLDIIDEFLAMTEGDDEGEEVDESTIDEAMKTVIRKGKRVRKLMCPEGKKALNGRCVRISSKERRVRSKASKIGARKARSKQGAASRKRARSMAKR